MARGKAFLVVGHKQWGKSRTLKALTDENHRIRSISIGDCSLFIRRMSNDDKPNDFRALVRKLRPAQHGDAILAFCPVFDEDAGEILADLKEYYDIHSFVLRHSFDGERHISAEEIAALREFGPVQLFENRAEPADRAEALRAFIERHLGR